MPDQRIHTARKSAHVRHAVTPRGHPAAGSRPGLQLSSLEAPPIRDAPMPRRRDFLSQLGLAAAALAMDADELRAESAPQQSNWDTSWLDRLAKARYRVVFNANVIDVGGVFSYASTFFDQYYEGQNTTDAETSP